MIARLSCDRVPIQHVTANAEPIPGLLDHHILWLEGFRNRGVTQKRAKPSPNYIKLIEHRTVLPETPFLVSSGGTSPETPQRTSPHLDYSQRGKSCQNHKQRYAVGANCCTSQYMHPRIVAGLWHTRSIFFCLCVRGVSHFFFLLSYRFCRTLC